MATTEDALQAMRTDIEGIRAQITNVTTREQGERIIQDANAREAVHLQKAQEVDERMRRYERGLQEMMEEMEEMKKRMTTAEGRGGDEKKCIGYINMKNKEPKTFGEKPDDWKKWKDDLEDFQDAHNKGMKKLLKDIAETKEEISEVWKTDRNDKYDPKVLNDEDRLWKTLKQLTTMEARKIVMSTKMRMDLWHGRSSTRTTRRTLQRRGAKL